ncbi:MAG TPA: alpha/beta hydrolase [Gemmatimonadales bacterium]|nr:alpha/beta hydrolase [Gemmatimonadales bacterium]
MGKIRRGTLLVHGWTGSGPDHWQRWLAERLRARGAPVVFPNLPDEDTPELERWHQALVTARAELAALGAEEHVILCHSLGAVLWLHHVARLAAARVATPAVRTRVLLAAPPSPEAIRAARVIRGFLPVPLDGEALRRAGHEVALVGSARDEHDAAGVQATYGDPLHLRATILPAEAGHINTAAGYGPWPGLEAWWETGAPLAAA